MFEILIMGIITISAVGLDRYLNWRANRIKTIKPDPIIQGIPYKSFNICTCCAWYKEISTNFICLRKGGKIPINEIRKVHSCFMDEANFKSGSPFPGVILNGKKL